MQRTTLATAFGLLCLAAAPLYGQENRSNTNGVEDFGAQRVEVFKIVNDVSLRMHIFTPENLAPCDARPAIVFFFGGGWKGGSPRQFVEHSRYLASRGMVAMCAEYRVYNRHQAQVIDCVADAKSALRWARYNAACLGIDPDRIAAAGGSAGGHLAAAVATLAGFDEPCENSAISARPNALVLFNPALDLRQEAFSAAFRKERHADITARMGADPDQLSPTLHITNGTPPTIIFHGQADTTVPYEQAERFQKAMLECGNRCELEGYPDQAHGFFNYGRDGNQAFIKTLRKADEFLSSIGYLSGPATLSTIQQTSK